MESTDFTMNVQASFQESQYAFCYTKLIKIETNLYLHDALLVCHAEDGFQSVVFHEVSNMFA